jgi:hypothetical protein
MFYHTVPLYHYGSGVVHEAMADWDGQQYVYTEFSETGGQHMRFFDTIQDFVMWHYQTQASVILDEEHHFENELKFLFPSQADVAVSEYVKKMRQPTTKLKPKLVRHAKWDAPRGTLNTVLWTV